MRAKQFVFESKEQEWRYIWNLKNSESLTTEEWCRVVERHHCGTLIENDVSDNMRIFEMLKDFGVAKPEVGEHYIPVTVMAASSLMIYDVDGRCPPESKPRLLELVKIKNGDYYFDNNGRIQRYPQEWQSKVMVAETLCIPNLEQYREMVTMLRLATDSDKFNNLLTESLTSPYPLKLEYADRSKIDYSFRTDSDAKGDIEFWSKGQNSEWEMAFTIDGKVEHQNRNTGEVFRIFATAAKSVQMFLNTPEGYNMSTLNIEASTHELSRVKLYDRMVPILSKLGLKFAGTDNVGQYKNYHFVNPDNPPQAISEPNKNWRDSADWEFIENIRSERRKQ
jgi:hypothetical protein